MRYRLSTLMILAGAGPPAIACVWFFWRLLLFLAVCIVLIILWVIIGLAIARFFGGLVASVMD